jgi:hypothetical protein
VKYPNCAFFDSAQRRRRVNRPVKWGGSSNEGVLFQERD